MKLLFVHDTYYTEKGEKVFAHGAFPYALWEQRFLPHFERVTIIGRRSEGAVDGLPLSSGSKTSFLLLENINDPFRIIFKKQEHQQKIKQLVAAHEALVIRGPSEFGMIAAAYARAMKKPYVVEMSGCGFDNVWNHGSWLGKIYAPLKYLRVRKMVKNAAGVLYVTQSFLQRRYPTDGFVEVASNVEIDIPESNTPHLSSPLDGGGMRRLGETNAEPSRSWEGSDTKFIIGLIGNFENKLKGIDVAIKALASIKNMLGDFELSILGHGNPARWDDLIHQNNLEDHVIFDAHKAEHQDVLNWLDQLDLYIQPSRHEGLPRALIEAMSRGLPALASNAGGTNELLEPEFIHRKGDTHTLAKHIADFMDADYRRIEGQKNLETSLAYSKEILDKRRSGFYQQYKAVIAKNSGTSLSSPMLGKLRRNSGLADIASGDLEKSL